MNRTRQHAYTTTDHDSDPAPETSHAEKSRTLLHLGKIGVLSTHSQKQVGFPFGSVMPYALDPAGSPLFLISSMAMHTQNLVADPRGSLVVTEAEAKGDPLGAARLTVLGRASKVPKADVEDVRETYLGRHDNARYWVDFKDFAFYRMEILDIYFVGGFGVMGWVEADDFGEADPDPLAKDAQGILEHMNTDHAEALVLIARSAKGIEAEEAKMTAVDRLGFHVRLKTPERVRSVRIGFPAEVRSSEDCRDALVGMVREARSSLSDE